MAEEAEEDIQIHGVGGGGYQDIGRRISRHREEKDIQTQRGGGGGYPDIGRRRRRIFKHRE